MKIGILSSRHPETLSNVIQQLGSSAKVATVTQAAIEGEVLLLAISYWTLDEAIAQITPHVNGKIAINATNPLRYGTLADSRPLDPPSAIWNKVLTADEVRERLAQIQQAA